MGIIGAILGLVILSMVLGYATTKFREAMQGSSAQASSDAIAAIIRNARVTYAYAPNGFASVSNAALLKNGAVPPEAVGTGNVIRTAFGTNVTVAPAPAVYAPNDAMSISVRVQPERCSEFVWSLERDAAKIQVGSATVKDAAANVPLTAVALGAACGGGGGASTVATVFTVVK